VKGNMKPTRKCKVTNQNKALRVYSPALGVRIKFSRGYYRTNDSNEIAVLRRNDHVEEVADD
jgi:hypothetical protein